MSTLQNQLPRTLLLRSALALALVTTPAFSEGEGYEKLLQNPTRPTLAQVDAVLSEIPDEDPYSRKTEQWINLMIQHGPNILANMERTYPGAKWVFLGRDVAAWADFFEAFYESIGQKGRVSRVGVSKASFASVGNDKKTLFELMQANGLDVDDALDTENGHPFIFVDTVSGGRGRQGRQLLDAIYTEVIASKGLKPSQLLPRINIFGLEVSTFPGGTESHQGGEKEFVQDLLGQEYDTAKKPDFYENHRFLSLRQSPNRANEASYVHFLYAWNDSYLDIVRDKKGIPYAKPGELQNDATRRIVLWTQKKLINAARSPEFRLAVSLAAATLQGKYEFPLERPNGRWEREVAAPARASDFQKQIKDVQDYLDSSEARKYSANYDRYIVQLVQYAIQDQGDRAARTDLLYQQFVAALTNYSTDLNTRALMAIQFWAEIERQIDAGQVRSTEAAALAARTLPMLPPILNFHAVVAAALKKSSRAPARLIKDHPVLAKMIFGPDCADTLTGEVP